VNVTVESADPQDLDAVIGLFSQYLTFYEVTQPPERIRAFIRQRFEDGDSLVLVARSGGATVGFAQVYPTQESLSLGSAWVLYDLFVAPDARGLGAGRALVRAVLARAAEAGVVYVSLDTAKDNTRAQKLYEQEGFVRDTHFLHYGQVLGRA
jgi:ribosomal protein S18 acetylase RimI-like enzyme